jgi:perosamine synthetase
MSSRPAIIDQIVAAVRQATGQVDGMPVPLHAPSLEGNAWHYVKECIDTGWVSSAGSYVAEFEKRLAAFTGAAHAVACVNGTAALHVALQLAGVEAGDEVLMPALTFVATANAVAYCGAVPHLCDVERRTLGIDPAKLGEHLQRISQRRPDGCYNRDTGRRLAAIVPMHTLGHPVDMDPLVTLGAQWAIPIVEDAAESLGSYYRGRHTGRLGRLGILSFNGNKIVTTGGGGAILSDDAELARRARHLTTTARVAHGWEFIHDQVGYNYRMPNLNAALGVAQMEQLEDLLVRKRRLAGQYVQAFAAVDEAEIFVEPDGCRSNYWLNAMVLERSDVALRDQLLSALNEAGMQSRPIWRPMHQLAMYCHCPQMDLGRTDDLAGRLINVPSGAGVGVAKPDEAR